MFNKIGSLLKNAPKSSGRPNAIVALQVRSAAKVALKIVLSDLDGEIAESISPTVFKNGVLVVSCSPLVASELKIRSGGLIEEINRELGVVIVRSLRFRVG